MSSTHRCPAQGARLSLLLALLHLLRPATASSLLKLHHHQQPYSASDDEDPSSSEQEDFLQKMLQNVLGIENPSHNVRHSSPPQYMLDLYNTVAGSGGLTLASNPYHANVVRSYLDKDSSHNLKFFFNVSSSMRSKKDRVLEAEFHLYKMKPRLRAKEKANRLRSQLLQVNVYQVMYKGKKKKKKDGAHHRLLDSRRMTVHSTGWEVFYVKEAVIDWMKDNSTNLGLLVTIRSLENEPVPNGLVRFSKKHHRMANRHPLLVLFVDDGRHAKQKYYPQKDEHTYGYPEQKPNSTEAGRGGQQRSLDGSWRKQRAVSHSAKENGPRQSCTRHDLYVDFEKIGWSAWIISPKGYNAYHCKGECTFPLGQNQWPTNHATVQSIVHELKLTAGVDTPCCVPNKLYSISLLYFDEHENVILKQYDDMVASSCGCH